MLHPILDQEGIEYFVTKASLFITNNGPRSPESSEDVLMQEFDHHIASLVKVAIASTHFDQ